MVKIKMIKPKSRSIFNFIIVINLIWYIVLIFVIDVGTIGSIIYWSLFFILVVLRDTIKGAIIFYASRIMAII